VKQGTKRYNRAINRIFSNEMSGRFLMSDKAGLPAIYGEAKTPGTYFGQEL
jgi:hypothetical protein